MSASAPRARVCERCGNGRGVTFHIMQAEDGFMRSVIAHVTCFKKIRAEVEAKRAAAAEKRK